MHRRGAGHIARYDCLIQMFMNALQVLKKMNKNMTKGGIISELFEIEAKEQVPLKPELYDQFFFSNFYQF